MLASGLVVLFILFSMRNWDGRSWFFFIMHSFPIPACTVNWTSNPSVLWNTVRLPDGRMFPPLDAYFQCCQQEASIKLIGHMYQTANSSINDTVIVDYFLSTAYWRGFLACAFHLLPNFLRIATTAVSALHPCNESGTFPICCRML